MKQSPERFTPEMTGDIRHEHQHRYALAGEFVAGKDVLDIASGEGYGAAYLAREAKSVIGVDIDPEAIEHSRRRYAGLRNIEFRTGSCAAIPLGDHSVDVVTSFETLEHHDEHTEMMREIKRVLRPEGVLLISSPNRPVYSEEPNFVNPFHVKELDYQEFADLVERHFRFVQILGQKIAAGSLVFPLSGSAPESFASYATNGDQVSRRVPALSAPVYFIAVCSDVPCEQGSGLSSVYVDTHAELLEATRAELSLLRATHLQELSEIEKLSSHLRAAASENKALARDREALGRDRQALARALAEVRSSSSFQFVSKVVWRVSQKIPRVFRSPLKKLLKKKSARQPNEGEAQDFSAGESKLHWSIDTDLSQPLVVGKGNILYLKGWCYHPDGELSALDIVVNGVAHPVSNHSLGEPRVFNKTIDIEDHSGQSLTSAFWTALEFEQLETSREIPIRLRATLSNGKVVESEIETVTVVPFLPSPKAEVGAESQQAKEPLIAICLATYNPPLDLLTKQIDSLIAQTHRNWLCIISDDGSQPEVFDEIRRIAGRDPRFQVFRNQARLGFLQNFERCLNLVPTAVEYVAFCDQDDEWYSDKLEVCLRAFEADTQLVFSDMKIVKRDGETISDTYWSNRSNNFTDLGALFLANTVTGASMLFRQELLKEALPFPRLAGSLFHDHWIACVALSKGPIKYVDRPLYVYRQHDGNVHGHLVGEPTRPKDVLHSILALRFSLMGDAIDLPGRVDSVMQTYFDYAVKIISIARVIKLRRIAGDKRKQRVIDRFVKMENSLASLSREVLRLRLHRAPTIGQEFVWLRAVLSMRLLQRHVRQNRARLIDLRTAESDAFQPPLDATPIVDFIPQKIAPLKLDISSGQRRRVNILVSEVNFQYLFAGYVCVFNMALELKRAGYDVRIVLVDECDFRPAEWNRQLESYEGLAGLFDRVEVAYVFDRSTSLSVSPHDAFIATSWWTAHVAHQAVRDLKQERFVYLVLEYDPLFYPAGSFYALAAQSYTFPHLAVFSTDLLRDYFQANKIGVFSENAGADPIFIQNAANRFEVSESAMRARTRKRLLFYARPDQRYTARNVFELGVLALREAIQAGYFQSHDWEFHGLGAAANYSDVPLDKRTDLIMLPKVSLQDFVKVLPTYDLGLTLMLSPHPSLMPMDMAAAGLVTVTNTFATKTRERMSAISSNIIAVAPTLDGLTQGLATAVDEVDNFEKRLAGSKLNWSTSWAETFSPEVMTRLREYLDHSAEVSRQTADAFLTATTIS
jgi:ubiquinone/menaquinone biosynthesis C-methylase UbiE/glycosyltransferase involved in cell wall biosynthesis